MNPMIFYILSQRYHLVSNNLYILGWNEYVDPVVIGYMGEDSRKECIATAIELC